MKKGTLPQKTVLLWQIRVVMLTAIIVAICIYYGKAMPFLNSVALIIALISLALNLFYIPKFLHGFEILFKNDAIIINYGVLIKFSHIMPYSRLIYAQSFATPLSRLFGVTALSLKAARSRVIVPEIKLEDAIKIINSLTNEVLYDKEI